VSVVMWSARQMTIVRTMRSVGMGPLSRQMSQALNSYTSRVVERGGNTNANSRRDAVAKFSSQYPGSGNEASGFPTLQVRSCHDCRADLRSPLAAPADFRWTCGCRARGARMPSRVQRAVRAFPKPVSASVANTPGSLKWIGKNGCPRVHAAL
jgi:hypothetical protein